LVDPSFTTRINVSRLLEARGHEVLSFADEHDALACLAADPRIEALIASAELKSMSGFELCWEARLLETCRRPIYVLLMSSSPEQGSLIEALDAGADDFIGNPPLVEELYARLRSAERIASMQRELIRLARTDPLTGLCNRRGFFERANEVCERAARSGELTAILLDIDNFKRINDAYGHDSGDLAIRACAQAAATESQLVGRLGGDEFALILEQSTLPIALAAAEDLRLRLAEHPVETEKGMIRLTCSFGVSEARCGDSIDELLGRADEALYAAKTRGRNRVVCSQGKLLATSSTATTR
jgi:diguanylate cyclase (GGDEF)-like protein